MEPQNNQDWQSAVKKDITELFIKHKVVNLKLDLSSRKKKLLLWLSLCGGIGFLIFGLIYENANAPDSIMTIMAYIVAGGIIIPVTTLAILHKRITKARKKVIAEINVNNYYTLALSQLTNNKYKLLSLKKQFDLPPLKIPSNSKVDNVMNISGQGTKFSFGTMTTRTIITNGNNQIETYYTRFLYLNTFLLKPSELVATIKKAVPLANKFKSQDNVNLESAEFEKIFNVVANDQILIRKLLTPKVLAKIVDQAKNDKNENKENNHKQIPKIELNTQNFTMVWPGVSVSGWNDPKKAIGDPSFFGKNKKENIADTICQKINDDVNMFLKCLNWADTLEVL